MMQNRNWNSDGFIWLYSLGQGFPYLDTLNCGTLSPFTSYISQAIFSVSRIENIRFVVGFFPKNIKRNRIRKYLSF